MDPEGKIYQLCPRFYSVVKRILSWYPNFTLHPTQSLQNFVIILVSLLLKF